MTVKRGLPIIGITLGDPQGIGPEVVQKALRSPIIRRTCRPIVFGDPRYFDHRLSQGLSPRQCGLLSAYTVRQAVHAAMRREVHAIVTAPIAKERWGLAGIGFQGHTEYLAHLMGTRKVRMMMTGRRLRVTLVTIHEPLRHAIRRLTTQSVLETIQLTDQALKKWFRLRRPRIALAALNPHAGESGIFGDEESRLLLPAVRRAKQKGILVDGPSPPDTVYYWAANGRYDAVVSLYHDQGLIPVKLLHFKEAVNLTLGLPIIRTSPDHGTAFDIAAKGVADPQSMIAAIEMAAQLALTHT